MRRICDGQLCPATSNVCVRSWPPGTKKQPLPSGYGYGYGYYPGYGGGSEPYICK